VSWLAWRQFRANALVGAITAAAAVAVLILTSDHIARVAGTDQLTTGYESLRLLGTGLVGAPAVIGAFWGAPLLAREIETGTYRLAWTQSVTRRRWLTTRLAVTALGAVVVVGSFSLVFTWWSAPFDEFGNRIGTANFGQRGIVPVAYAMFALALGTFAGAVLRRTLPAMGATLAGFFVVRFSFQWLVRAHLVAATTATLPNNSFGQRDEQLAGMGGWVLSSHTVDATGQRLTDSQIDRLLVEACHLTRDSTRADSIACIDRLGIHDVAKVHPASHFWPLQLWESAIFLALAATLVALSVWWIRNRAA
jgi:ABC-type transport system involved in multi-copper enzyme maturation permease subunit